MMRPVIREACCVAAVLLAAVFVSVYVAERVQLRQAYAYSMAEVFDLLEALRR